MKMKNCRTYYEAQTASRLMEIVQPPPKPTHNQIKSNYVFVTKMLLRRYSEIYRHLLSKCYKNRVLERQDMAQCKFSDTKQSERFLAGFETFC